VSRFTLDPGVNDDLDAIWDYIGIQKCSPASAVRQIELLYEKFVLLASHPMLGEARDDLAENLRAFVARPFVVLYRPTHDGVQIVQVVHSARDIQAVFRRKKS